ncbi:MAG: UDP-N-acetylmuramate--L-alanine ligase [Legionella sp.]|nr:MAG: UDP-N-acetylmuramate--L-alanine ligase [Legionella sp.]
MNNSGQFLSPRMGRVEQIHFVGIGGVGMCGIAEVLHNEGYRITGSDLGEGSTVQRLRGLGIQVFVGHQRENVVGADVVVRSSAVDMNNPEIVAAREAMIPVIPRAAMLAELMRFRQGIAIAGTHGKTTTTSLVSSLLAEGGLDPSFVIGGKLNSCGANAQLGHSPYFVVEADESDASFLFLKPTMAVVTNIDADHMETYNGSFDKLRTTFLEFLHHLPFYGLAVVCIEDKEICQILPAIQRPTVTYGFKPEAHYRAENWTQNGMVSRFTVKRPEPYAPLEMEFQYPGRHNVLNALAAIAIATELKVDDDSIVRGLKKFQGVGRRFQMLGEKQFEQGSAIVVDDYGHHPQEILSTIDAFRHVWPDKRLVHVFQPHRFSRTQSLYEQFVDVLSLSDELLLFDIYSAGEKEIPGVNSENLAKEIRGKNKRVTMVNESSLKSKLDEFVQDGDVILMQGAGSIGQMAVNLMKKG